MIPTVRPPVGRPKFSEARDFGKGDASRLFDLHLVCDLALFQWALILRGPQKFAVGYFCALSGRLESCFATLRLQDGHPSTVFSLHNAGTLLENRPSLG
jgi:hypothetical protein